MRATYLALNVGLRISSRLKKCRGLSLVGTLQETALKKHGRRAWSVVTLALRSLVRAYSRQVGVSVDELLHLIRLWTPHQKTGTESVGY